MKRNRYFIIFASVTLILSGSVSAQRKIEHDFSVCTKSSFISFDSPNASDTYKALSYNIRYKFSEKYSLGLGIEPVFVDIFWNDGSQEIIPYFLFNLTMRYNLSPSDRLSPYILFNVGSNFGFAFLTDADALPQARAGMGLEYRVSERYGIFGEFSLAYLVGEYCVAFPVTIGLRF